VSDVTAEALNLPPDLRAKLQEALRHVIEAAAPRLVILFGSYAEGEAHEQSDVDLLVVADTPSWHTLSMALRKVLRPLLKPFSLDLLVYSSEDWEKDRRLVGFVAREADLRGVRLYERP
jgi:uncharacterized protein